MEFLSAALIIIVLSIVVEFLVERIKSIVQIKEAGKVQLVPFYALAVGLIVAFVVQVDFYLILGEMLDSPLNTIPVIGYITTGLIISGGSVGVHELFSKLRESRYTD